MTYQIRTAQPDDWDAIMAVVYDAFHADHDEAAIAVDRIVTEPERNVVAEYEGRIVGNAAVLTRDLAIPGGVVPAAHVTAVSVDSVHRRQGLLTRMIDELHASAVTRGEPIAVLWASEGTIYQRYGYGPASHNLRLEGRSRSVVWREPPTSAYGRLRAVPATSPEPFQPIYDAVWQTRTGWSSRDGRSWQVVLADVKSQRDGATARRAVVHEDDDGNPDGYILWRVKSDWDEAGANSIVKITELVAETPAAYQALWQFALSIDLTRRFSVRLAAVDEPIRLLITEPRAIQTKLSEALWVRILDVPAALSARRYAAPVDVVLDVTDARLASNAGRWHLVGSADHAVCTPTEAPAALAMDVHALGAAYLGGTTLSALAAAGAVRELRAGTLAATSTGFGWHRQPYAIEMF